MKAIAGVLLIIPAIVGFAMGGISFTQQKKDVDMGPVQISHQKTSMLPISSILSTISLIAGGALVFVGMRNKKLVGRHSDEKIPNECSVDAGYPPLWLR